MQTIQNTLVLPKTSFHFGKRPQKTVSSPIALTQPADKVVFGADHAHEMPDFNDPENQRKLKGFLAKLSERYQTWPALDAPTIKTLVEKRVMTHNFENPKADDGPGRTIYVSRREADITLADGAKMKICREIMGDHFRYFVAIPAIDPTAPSPDPLKREYVVYIDIPLTTEPELRVTYNEPHRMAGKKPSDWEEEKTAFSVGTYFSHATMNEQTLRLLRAVLAFPLTLDQAGLFENSTPFEQSMVEGIRKKFELDR